MSNAVLVIGQSGSGKSTSLRNLDPASTFIINVLDKPLPFRGYKKNYESITKENKNGNYYCSCNWKNILGCIGVVNDEMHHISTLIIDDWQYILTHEFMNRVNERGYDKYSDMANHGWSTMTACINTRPSLTTFVLSHSDLDPTGKSKLKTIGKLLDEKVTLEGMFTTVLHSRIIDGQYLFQTQADNEYLAKSPIDMFKEQLIPNDLLLVKKAIETYYDNN